MREQNFSLPTTNKASISITTALYDRRALDCTSTLPLIHSLNNLAYLTISSSRIRDILTVDGGIERLVCILKEGRSKDTMETWKWNLAFQCIVNIGVRGSEAVRTRVVEADMVPVIATLLDSYFKGLEKSREVEQKRKCPIASSSRSLNRLAVKANEAFGQRAERSRRHAPPPIAIPEPQEQVEQDEPMSETTPTAPTASLSLSSPPERTTFTRQHYHQRSHGGRAPFATPTAGRGAQDQHAPMSALPPGVGAYGFRPVRDADRLPSMVTTLQPDLSSQPQSPATPLAPVARAGSPGIGPHRRRRPSIRHQLSISGSDDDGQVEETGSDELNDADADTVPEPHVDIQSDIVMQDVVSDDDALLEPRGTTLTPDETETFNITHRTSTDNSTALPSPTPAQNTAAFPQTTIPPPLNPLVATPPNLAQTPAWLPQLSQRSFPHDPRNTSPASALPAMPRDEDVLMSLQLLAYVSKYCNLRSYFQHSHLVPRLKIDRDLHLLDPEGALHAEPELTLEEEDDAEFLPQPSLNIFPLIEKFTAKPRHPSHPSPSVSQQDMSYWAGVVMRNLCRKDDSKGGIRQCAYWQCMKWEQFTREFAKCSGALLLRKGKDGREAKAGGIAMRMGIVTAMGTGIRWGRLVWCCHRPAGEKREETE
ncbi:hypothetical protein B0A48_00092 [Cryoendolithus antarcticus]|uniref:MYND-type zinc finger protein samB n=1 Tax=Cryoendolithus antarcticus TaxID=1507870 RepID=A0A1V8TTR5_9PEZI|nr:hypothetical protein B0A48_00092 [Cryoendolithus antarcticus]